jgi:2-polyprenyl-6-methoxyphenol hydroxylase-like FAD-dependent oxidoreductase
LGRWGFESFAVDGNRILVSGAGIAGLTLAIELKKNGFEPVVIEREPALRTEGYMMDFFGTGWDVAERIGLLDRLHAIKYPIDALNFVDRRGKVYLDVPIARLRRALDNRYTYLRRQDLERVLSDRAREAGVEIRFGAELHSLAEQSDGVRATFVGGRSEDFALVVGADGVHSRVRALVFGPERQFARFLGLYVAAFHLAQDGNPLNRTCKLFEDADRSMFLYPLDDARMDATCMFRHDERNYAVARNLPFLRAQYRGAASIVRDVLDRFNGDSPLYFDGATQIVMTEWHRGRVALIGDACGCLTLLAGQGSHMAMAGAYVLAQELKRHNDHARAFAAYQAFLKPHVDKRQRDAMRFAKYFVPSRDSWPWLRHMTMALIFSTLGLRLTMSFAGSRSVLAGQYQH